MADSTTDPTSVLVATPFGPRPVANAHAIPTGGTVRHVGEEIHLLDATGKVVHTARRAPSLAESKSGNVGPSVFYYAATTFYTTATDDTKPDAITKSVVSWTVPPALVSWTGETMFFSSIVCNNTYGGGLQGLVSALQYGPSAAGGGKYWSIAVWHLAAQQTYYTPVMKVFPGTELTAVFTVVPGTNRRTASIFSHAPGPTYTAEFDAPFPEMYVCVGPGASEIPFRPLSYPPIPTVFGPISIGVTKDGKPSVPDVSWGGATKSSWDVSFVVDKEGPDDSQITFHYDKKA